jgi:hypothetical protein
MSEMEHPVASQSAVSESGHTSTGTAKEIKAHGDRNFASETLPSLGGTGPILPEWLRKRFRRKHTSATR